jgi:hypothetical protein
MILFLTDYDDWFLPSFNEMLLLQEQAGVIHGLPANDYWSSTEFNADMANGRALSGSQSFYSTKSWLHRVRAVRAF